MRVHFVVHESFEAPGVYETWAVMRGHEVTFSRVYSHQPLPKDARDIDLLIVMGGPQDPSVSIDECPHFDSDAEQALIASAVQEGKAIIGVCLGAQLVGEALGATFAHSPEKEIGKFAIVMTDKGTSNEMFSHFGDTLDVGHWHNDMPGLTPEAEILAWSEGCPRQIVAYSELVYGFQCHMELTPAMVELLIEHSAEDLRRAAGYRFVQSPDELRANNYTDMNRHLFTFLDKLESRYRQTQDLAGPSAAERH